MKLPDPVSELNPLDDFGQAVLTVELSPLLMGGHHQFEGHGSAGLAPKASLGSFGSVAHAGKGAFDRVGRPDVLLVLHFT